MSEKKQGLIGQTLSKLWALVKVYLIGVGLFWTAVPILLVSVISSKSSVNDVHVKKEKPVKVSGDSFLELKLTGFLTEVERSPSDLVLARLFDEKIPRNFAVFLQQLEDIAHTDHIKGILIDMTAFYPTAGQTGQIDRAFDLIKSKGKKLWVYAASYNDSTYRIASNADQVVVSPAGEVMLTGGGFNIPYFGEALRKIGVDVEVVKSGEYKTAAEPFTRNGPSSASQAALSTIIDKLDAAYVSFVANRRTSGNKALVKEWLERSYFTAQSAKQEMIVDDVLHYEAFKDRIVNKIVSDEAESMEFSKLDEITLADLSDYKEIDDLNKIALLDYSGDIVLSDFSQGEGVIYPELVEQDVEWILEQKDVKAAVLRISSPGGSALASEIIWSHLNRLKKKIPLVVSMGETTASGGYYMASAGNKIVAHPSTLTGSIGVIGMIPNFKQFKEKYGVSFHSFSNSKRAAFFNPGESLSEADKSLLLKSIEETYDLFLNRVAAGRKMGKNEVDKIAQGRVWSGIQALEVGLVDKLGGLKDAYRLAKELAGLDVKKANAIVRPYTKRNFFDCLQSGDWSGCVGKGFDLKKMILPADEYEMINSVKQRFRLLQSVNQSPIQMIITNL